MQRAKPEDLREETVPILQARLSESELYQLIPVEFEELDPLSEPEPSIGTLLQLNSGDLVVVTYGRETRTLSLEIPESESIAGTSIALFEEIPLLKEKVTWHTDNEAGILESSSPRIAAK